MIEFSRMLGMSYIFFGLWLHRFMQLSKLIELMHLELVHFIVFVFQCKN